MKAPYLSIAGKLDFSSIDDVIGHQKEWQHAVTLSDAIGFDSSPNWS
jgi:hypothetical protein